MDNEEREVKQLLIDLNDKQEHLQATIAELESKIRERELEVQQLLADRELELARSAGQNCDRNKAGAPFCLLPSSLNKQDTSVNEIGSFSSEFTREVASLLNNIHKNTQEISSLIKL